MNFALPCDGREVYKGQNAEPAPLPNVSQANLNFTYQEIKRDDIPSSSDRGSISDVVTSEVDDTNTTPEDLLKNGILIETSKGLICMSLKDVLSSNLNISEEDIQHVAAELLSQQNTSSSNSTVNVVSSMQDLKIPEEKLQQNNLPGIKVSQNILNKPIPATMESSYKQFLQNYYSSSDESYPVRNESTSNVTSYDSEPLAIPYDYLNTEKGKIVDSATKRRGGWPKGRKRKPELINPPPKAPKTSYNIFLNERRKLYKDKLAFHEITRVVGNQWSNLSAEEKKPYIAKAAEDKKRYQEELLKYRQSDAYKLYLARKKRKRIVDNLLSESDMDGTDDIEDEDDDSLYCDMCDQWFYNMHNKREHLLSRQHQLVEADDMSKELASSDSEYKGHISSFSFSTSLDESSLDAAPVDAASCSNTDTGNKEPETVSDVMSNLLDLVTQREKEIKILQVRLNELVLKKTSYMLEFSSLKEKANVMKNELLIIKNEKCVIDEQIYQLCQAIILVNNSNLSFVS